MYSKDCISNGLLTAFIDANHNSNIAFRPEFVFNDYKNGKKVITTLEQELNSCEEFFISVAFITMGGIVPLLNVLKELENRGIQGKILTTDYLMFSDPKAIEKIHGFSNIQIKMYHTKKGEGFHTKGYIFKKEDRYDIIIGSSNLTLDAITKNKEWNTKLVSLSDGELSNIVIKEFNQLWDSENSSDYEDFIEEYREKYLLEKKKQEMRERIDTDDPSDIISKSLQPNAMQKQFISKLLAFRNQGIDKALLISSTGTGKTFASAFGIRELDFKRVLFIVHREQIAKQASKTFKLVFGKRRDYGILSGNRKDVNKDFIFATMQTASKNEIMELFKKDEFDAIIIDEVHHAGAESYKKIMGYFTPKLWLGMTASPETRNHDIYSIFEHNIVYEIRLQQAMEEDLLCPFHYFGITDLYINDKNYSEELDKFNCLVSEQRVDYVIEHAKFYGFSGSRVKGLVFCSKIEEAKKLSLMFNEKGYKTECLTGGNSIEEREEVIERLVTDDVNEDQLDYIFTVDIFNEGVDIPEINQVIMLRPTESPVIFIQQLGRGLRKSKGKEYLVILDFIGNHANNYMIPMALTGSRGYNKDGDRKIVSTGTSIIPGSSTINFDEISKQKIYESIDAANYSDIKIIKNSYFNLKNKLGRIPKMEEFDLYGEIDLMRIFQNKSLGSYYNFLVKYDSDDYKVRLSKTEALFIKFISVKLAEGKRVHELALLDIMLKEKSNLIDKLYSKLKEEYGIVLNDNAKQNIINIMSNNFLGAAQAVTYKDCVFIEKDTITHEYNVSSKLNECLKSQHFTDIVKELIDFGVQRYKKQYADRYKNTNLVLYKKYTYEDVCRLLDWDKKIVDTNIGGYFYDVKTKTFPVFINYHKDESINATIKYEDYFIDSKHLIAISKQSRTINSPDVQRFINSKQNKIKVELFVRKNKNDTESKEFYYLGRMHPTGYVEEFIMNNTSKTAVKIGWELEQNVREDIYQYITKE